MIKFVQRGAALLFLLCLTACGGPEISGRLLSTTPVTSGSISGVYVYSFLQNGPASNDAINQRVGQFRDLLLVGLRARGLRADVTEASGAVSHLSESSGRIPVRETIQANSARERSFGATHRIILTPTDMINDGYNHYWGTLTWALQSVSDDSFVALGQMHYVVGGIRSTSAQQMANQLLSKLGQMNLIPPAPTVQ